jgi:hypothetical protein
MPKSKKKRAQAAPTAAPNLRRMIDQVAERQGGLLKETDGGPTLCTTEEVHAVIDANLIGARAAARILGPVQPHSLRASKTPIMVAGQDGGPPVKAIIIHATLCGGKGTFKDLSKTATGFGAAVLDSTGMVESVWFLGVGCHASKIATEYKLLFTQPGLGKRVFGSAKKFVLPE